MKYYQSPVTGEQWTEEQYLEYVAFEESRSNSENECEDCCGCEKCEA